MGCTDSELSVLLTDDEEMRDLNSRFRGKDRSTDVLSFPMPQDDPTGDKLLGDVAISIERAREQALSYGATFEEELTRLLIHGTLHLIGYDHVNGGRQAAKMKAKEEELLTLVVEEGFV